MKKVNINDVAKLANVPKSTVSKVFNNDEDIFQTTKDKVLQVTRILDYRPSLIPGTLRKELKKVRLLA